MDPPANEPNALQARRRELELAYEEKLRDLKAQHKRRMEALDNDRLDWEASRKTQAKDLADRAERVKRAEDNQRRDAEALRAARAELDAAKAELAQQRVLRSEVREAAVIKQGADERLRATRGLLAGATFLGVAVTASAAAFLAVGSLRIAQAILVVGLLAALGLEWRRRRLARRD